MTAPAAPTGLTAATAGNTIVLDWNDNSESDLFGYYIYRSTTSGSGYKKLEYWPTAASTYTDTGVTGGITYYYKVTALDTSCNESGYSTQVSATPVDTGMGKVLRQYWIGISGTAISNLTSNVNYPNNPSGSEMITILEGPTNWGNTYGTRIRGYLHPPTTGSYTFWISGDDNCQLWLSTNGNPANAIMIASVPGYTNSRQWTKYTEQTSTAITLSAGQKYYIEVLHKEGTGGDHVAVAWSGPGISQQVIPGTYLSRWFVGLYGDFNYSGHITIEDVAYLLAAWLENNCTATAGIDINGDCMIDLDEFSEMAKNWLE
jgi:hypothetical protein